MKIGESEKKITITIIINIILSTTASLISHIFFVDFMSEI